VFGVCVVPAVSAAVAGGVVVFVVELLAFFFALGGVAVCAEAIDPTIRNALTQKLAANFKYLFIDPSCHPFSTPAPTIPGRYNFCINRPLSCGPSHAVIQTKYSSLLRQI
jgi:hypothetical protein